MVLVQSNANTLENDEWGEDGRGEVVVEALGEEKPGKEDEGVQALADTLK